MIKRYLYVAITLIFFGMLSCKKEVVNSGKQGLKDKTKGMVWISRSTYTQGAAETDLHARTDEKPAHNVTIDGFWIDIHEVTNAEFKKFVDATGYITTAERAINWEELKTQLPDGTPKPHDSILQPGSIIFQCCKKQIKNLNDYSQWWQFKTFACWRYPQGKNSNIIGKESYPVVHISYEDALAYCNWSGKSLPTEAEWEYAARGGLKDKLFPWGNENTLSSNANTWEGVFPNTNIKADGYERLAPVKSYLPNGYGLYDMSGNVWEWTQDWYDNNYYLNLAKNKTNVNPKGPKKPRNLKVKEKVIRGGSFLCHESYCASYRVSARMASSVDTGLEHLGFRTVLRTNPVSVPPNSKICNHQIKLYQNTKRIVPLKYNLNDN